jgi:ribonucleoside-diphosphate reductase alpha chain
MIEDNIQVKAPTFTYEEVLEKTKAYFDGDELAATTWINKYALRDKEGNYLEVTPDDMHRRLAKEFARIEDHYTKNSKVNGTFSKLSAYGQKRKKLSEDRIYELLKDFKYVVPQGSVMSACGNPHMVASLSNCVVIPSTYDSYGGILYSDQQLAQLFKRRCGVGVDISQLRPDGANVTNAAGTSTGAVSFMERFSNTTREVAQNGRRGALMITIDIAHPDVKDFVTIKQDLKKVTGANISVRLSDEFMEAVANDTDYTHRWPIDAEEPEYTRTVKARELWEIIIKCAHNTAEPGLIFWDRQHDYSTSSVYPGFKNDSTNPCSEIAMQGGDSCRLIALNFYSFVDNPFTDNASINRDKLYQVSYEAQRMMDDLVDLELEAIERIMEKIDQDPEPSHVKQIERETWQLLYETGKKGRRTGLGFTALADTVAAMGHAFDSDEALVLIDEIMRIKCEAEFDASIDMALERGKFDGFDPQIEQESEFVHMLREEFPALHERMMDVGRRNISISTVAPTGSLSMLTQTSSGIEPVFMLSYKRRRKVNPNDTNARVDFTDEMGDAWQEFTVYHNKLETWMEKTGNKEIDKSPYEGSTASEIDWEQRVKLQAAVQKYVTHSISSTVNLPKDVSEEEVGKIYLNAWRNGLKGITVYRDGSRSGVLISEDEEQDEKNDSGDVFPTKRPDKLEAEVVRFQNDNDKWIAVIGLIKGKPYEIFTGKAEDVFALPAWVKRGWVIKNRNEDGSSRYDFQFLDQDGYRITIEGLSRSFNKEYWNYAKLISSVLRHSMPLPDVVDLVTGLNLYSDHINTWKNGVARSLKKFIPDGAQAKDKSCPDCDDPEGLVYEEGCLKCKSCGYTKCG